MTKENIPLKSSIPFQKTGNGPAIALLHGFPFDRSIWKEMVSSLAENFTVYNFDLPGFGSAVNEGVTFTFQDACKQIKEVLDADAVHKLVLCGHSMGGYVALHFAKLFPEMVAGISLMNSTATADDEEKKESRLKTIALIKKGGKDLYLHESITKCFSSSYRNENPEMVQHYIDAAKELPVASLTDALVAMREREDATARLKDSKMPIQWIAGAKDEIIVTDKLLPLVQLAEVNFFSVSSVAAHMCMLEDAAHANLNLSDFVTYCFKKGA